MKNIIKNTVILLVITLVAGFALAFVYEITKAPIAAAEEDEKIEAYEAVFAEASRFTDCEVDLASFDAPSGVTVDEVKCARDDAEKLLGWVMKITCSEGYGGDITVAIGITAEGEISAMTVISMSETAGLGAKCTSTAFLDQFKGIKSDKVVYTQNGKSADNEIDAIANATITTKAVTKAVNAGLSLAYKNLMQTAE